MGELNGGENENANAWRMLGKCHAEVNRDHEAILCFENALEVDPHSQGTYLDLATSCLNALHRERALECLKLWIIYDPKYLGMTMMEVSDDFVELETDHKDASLAALEEV